MKIIEWNEKLEAAGFKPCGHSALSCYNGAGACCADCDHGTYWNVVYTSLHESGLVD